MPEIKRSFHNDRIHAIGGKLTVCHLQELLAHAHPDAEVALESAYGKELVYARLDVDSRGRPCVTLRFVE